jgi:DNA-binding NtrC family response regulator
MLELQRVVERVASRPISVLVLGETGTGKELVARALHEHSPRGRGPLKIINCAAIPDHLTESLLFGHLRGAFTGAHRDQPGVFAQAHGGTLFLDEVGELSSAAQAALLRVLDTKRICPIGGARDQEVDVRVIAATHRDLALMAARGDFRLDLYHRLNSVVLQIPPLRERVEDIVPLFEHFLAGKELDSSARPRVDHDTVARLLAYDWPGNVRELRNVAERALALFDGHSVRPEDLPLHVRSEEGQTRPAHIRAREDAVVQSMPSSASEAALDLRAVLRQQEIAIIREALRRSQGNQRRAAGLLRVPLRTLERKLRVLNVRSYAGH